MARVLSLALLAVSSYGLAPLEVCSGSAGQGELCAGGSPVILRGSNYIRLNHGHSTFAPESYDRKRYNAAFSQMQHDGYNVVRVFVLGQRIQHANVSSAPFDDAYVSRMIEFVNDAAQHGLYTVVTLERLPDNAYFQRFYKNASHQAVSWNAYMLQKEYHDAWEAYASELAKAMQPGLSHDAENGIILSLQNELFLESDKLPFSDSSISIKCADGKTYAMSDATQRQNAQDNNVNLWVNQLRRAWRSIFKKSLVTVGVFSFQAVHKTGPNGLMCTGKDCRFPGRPYWLSRSELDFLDVHIYQKDGSLQALDPNLDSMEWSGLDKSKPIIMGEFGCLGGLKGNGWYDSARQCAPHVKDLQMSSCSRGFSGWLFWTWDTDTPDEQPEWFSMMDESGAINGILAPIAFPDPCAKSLVAV